MIKLFITLVLFSTTAEAQNLLTEKGLGTVLTVPIGSNMSLDDYKSRARGILNFVETRIYPKVPSELLAKMKAKTLRIEFTSKINKGGLFDPAKSAKDELLLLVRENLFADEGAYRIIAHEWFHALHYTIHKDEPSWIREGMAQVFETIVLGGYNGPNLLAGLDQSTTPLEFVFNENQVDREAYGHTFLYFYFLYKRCGGEALFWKITESAPNRFGRDTLTAALNGSSENDCRDFETTVLNAELSRFHNRKVLGRNTQTSRYWLIPEFERTPAVIQNGTFDQSVINALPVHQPLLLSRKYKAAVKPFLKNPKLSVYTLSRSYPYLVQEGIGKLNSQDDEILFLMKRN